MRTARASLLAEPQNTEYHRHLDYDLLPESYGRRIMGEESKDELQKIFQLLEDVVRDAEAEIQRLQGLMEQEELYLDPEGTLSQP